MTYSESFSAYLAEEQQRFEAMTVAEQASTENLVDKYLTSNAVTEQLEWRANLINGIAAKLPKEEAGRALREGLGETFVKENASYLLKPNYTFQNVSPRHMKEHFRAVLDSFASRVDESALEEALQNAKNYLPERMQKTREYPMQATVNSLKDAVLASERSAEEKERLTKLLDQANEITGRSSMMETYKRSTHSLNISRAIYKESSKILEEAVKNGEDQGALHVQSGSVLANSLSGKPDVVEAIKSKRIVLSDADKAHYLKVLKTMQEKGLLRPDVPAAGEESRKEFAFRNMMDARLAVHNAMVAGDFDAMKAASEEYEKQVETMREIYRVAEEELGNDLHSFPDNVDNQRNEAIPVEFKENYKINAAVNSMYLTLQLIRETGVTVEEFLDDPSKAALSYMESFRKEYTYEAFTKGRTLGQTLAYAANLDPGSIGSTYPFPLATRPLEALNILSQDPSVKKQNLLAEHMVGALVVEYEMDSRRAHSLFTAELGDSVVNLLTMGEDGLREPGATSKKGYHDQTTFTFVEGVRPEDYLIDHPQDPAKLKRYIEKTILEYTQNVEKENPKTLQTLLEGTRAVVRNAVIYNNLDLKTPDAAALIRLYQDPKKELIAAGVKPEKLNVDYPPVSTDYILKDNKILNSKTKARLSLDKKTLRAEARYNKKAEKLETRIADAESKIANAKDEKTKAKLERARASLEGKLETLKDKEIKRLGADRAAGKLTDVYYQRRTNDVRENGFRIKRDLYNDALRIDKADFLAARVKDGMPEKDALTEYARIEAQNAHQARNLVGRVRYSNPERKLDLSKPDPAKPVEEKTAPTKESPKEKDVQEQKTATVKQLDLSDKIRKTPVAEIKREREPATPERSIEKEQDEQVR